jgi:predicted exporter
VAGIEGVRLLDQKRTFEEIYTAYRARTMAVVASGIFTVLAILWLRYRDLRSTFAAFLPSLLVALILVFLAAATRLELNLLHVVGLVLVMGMGVDYGIFVVDSRRRPADLDATMLSLALSCATTIFIFGLLARSSHPVLNAVGLTTGAGVLLSFLLAPAALVMAGPASERT